MLCSLSKHIEQQDRAFLWVCGVFVGALTEVEMSMAKHLMSIQPPPVSARGIVCQSK